VRIALVHYSYSPVVGGVETVLQNHARIFAAAGHRVTVYCREGSANEPGIEVQTIPKGSPGADLLRQTLPEQDAVFAHNVLTMPFEPEWTEALLDLAPMHPTTLWFSWVHDLAATNPHYTVPAGSALRSSPPGFRSIAISEHRAGEFLGLTGTPCAVIPNGIDPAGTLQLTPAVADLARILGWFKRDWILLHPARMLPRKNIEFSLRTLHATRSMGLDCVLLVTGAPDAQNPSHREYAAALERLREELDLQQHAFFLHAFYEVSNADPDIPPLSELLPEGGLRYPPGCAPGDLACSLIALLAQKPQNLTRKRVLQTYAWETVAERFLLPLLESKHPFA
jgi:glycosyltransferase involved in cell wall biosynthesis